MNYLNRGVLNPVAGTENSDNPLYYTDEVATFFGSHKGAERGVIYYSQACSCRFNNINFFEYLSDIINQAASLPPHADYIIFRNLLPDMRQKSHN